MSINYTEDIVNQLFADNVGVDASLPSNWANPSPAQQRLLTFIEIMRGYLADIQTVHEAKVVRLVASRMPAAMKIGSRPL